MPEKDDKNITIHFDVSNIPLSNLTKREYFTVQIMVGLLMTVDKSEYNKNYNVPKMAVDLADKLIEELGSKS